MLLLVYFLFKYKYKFQLYILNSRTNYKLFSDFQTKVLMKLEEIIENQKTTTDLLRQIQNQQVTDTNNSILFGHLESPMDDEKEL